MKFGFFVLRLALFITWLKGFMHFRLFLAADFNLFYPLTLAIDFSFAIKAFLGGFP